MLSSNFVNEYPVTVGRKQFLCIDVPALMDASTLHWKRKSLKEQKRHVRDYKKKLKEHHEAVIAAFQQVPAMQNELKVCRFLVARKDAKIAKRKVDQGNEDKQDEQHALTKQERRIRKLQDEVDECKQRPYATPVPMDVDDDEEDEAEGEDIGSEDGSQDEADAAQDEADEEAERSFARSQVRRSNPDQILREQLKRDDDVQNNKRVQTNQKARERRAAKKENANKIVVEDDDDYPPISAEEEAAARLRSSSSSSSSSSSASSSPSSSTRESLELDSDPEVKAAAAKMASEAYERKRKHDREEAVIAAEARLKLSKLALQKATPPAPKKKGWFS
jgi:hypothetical protein